LAHEIAGDAKTIQDVNHVLRLMMKPILERMLDTEMDVHLGRQPGCLEDALWQERTDKVASKGDGEKKRPGNRRNGRSSKIVQGELGEFEIETPRDREGSFEPQVIEKYQRRVEGFDEKILKLYAKGLTTRDIQEIVQELYGGNISATLISEITAVLDAEVTAWRTRPLDHVWPIVYFDGIVVHVRGANGRVSQPPHDNIWPFSCRCVVSLAYPLQHHRLFISTTICNFHGGLR
jgi:transposase-like protein